MYHAEVYLKGNRLPWLEMLFSSGPEKLKSVYLRALPGTGEAEEIGTCGEEVEKIGERRGTERIAGLCNRIVENKIQSTEQRTFPH
jgi:hypothetical protein